MYCTEMQSPRAHLYVVEMLRFMSDINQPRLPSPFHSVVSVSVFMALSTVFHSTSSPDNFPLCLPDVDFDAHPKQMQLGTLRAGVTSAIFSETEIQSRTKWGMRGVA